MVLLAADAARMLGLAFNATPQTGEVYDYKLVAGMTTACEPYPSDVSHETWMPVAPYLPPLPADAGQQR
jgi:hypothetical protein